MSFSKTPKTNKLCNIKTTIHLIFLNPNKKKCNCYTHYIEFKRDKLLSVMQHSLNSLIRQQTIKNIKNNIEWKKLITLTTSLCCQLVSDKMSWIVGLLELKN